MRIRPAFAGLAGLALLGACSDTPDEAAQAPDSYPALWELADAEGKTEGWLFCTIHALPDGVQWSSPRLDETVAKADLLVVEVAKLDDEDALGDIFARRAFDSPTGPLARRIDPRLQSQYETLLTKARVRSDHFDRMESWAAALALAQLVQEADPENGVDRVLIERFEGRDVVELEGAARQIAIFDALPEKEQRDLLNAVIEETRDYAKNPGRLGKVWRAGDVDTLAQLTQQGMLADPELREALLTARNIAWATQIENLLSAEDRPLIAVGAGHMFGEDGLPALLEARGFTIRRVE